MRAGVETIVAGRYIMKRMLLTGTTQGIGKCLYDRFKNDYDITTINRRYFEGNNIICDLSVIEQVEKIAEEIKKLQFDVVINNAGGAAPVVFEDMTADVLVQCTNLNYHAPVLLMQATLEGMKERGFGRIINISSIASKGPRPYIPHYGASKGALERFSSSMAVLYGNSGITINCVCPGGVKTETSIRNRTAMAAVRGESNDLYNKAISTNNGLGRMLFPEEIADTVEFLISDKASAISGQVINVCGTREVR